MVYKRKDDIATAKGEWGTPVPLFNLLNAEYGPFEIDLAASEENTKCDSYFDKEVDSLKVEWRKFKTAFLNPDHSKGVIDAFMEKCRDETRGRGLRIVTLIPLAAETGWFQANVMKAAEIRFISGRVNYVGKRKDGSVVTQSPPFTSCIAIFDKSLEQFGGRPVLGPTIEQTWKRGRDRDV